MFFSKKMIHAMLMLCVALIVLQFILTTIVVSGEDKNRGASKAQSVIHTITIPTILLTIACVFGRK